MFTNTVLAQGLNQASNIVGEIAKQSGASTYSEPQELIGTGINAALAMVGLIFLILMIYAGYLWLTSHGEEEPIKKAQKIIVSSVIGFILVVSAYAITIFVGKRFEVGGGGTAGEAKECSPKEEGWSCQSIDVCLEGKDEVYSANSTLKEKREICGLNEEFCKLNACPNDPNDIVCCENKQPVGEFFCEIICAKTDASDWTQEWKSDPISWEMVSKETYEADVSKCVASGKCEVKKYGDMGDPFVGDDCKELAEEFDCELELK